MEKTTSSSPRSRAIPTDYTIHPTTHAHIRFRLSWLHQNVISDGTNPTVFWVNYADCSPVSIHEKKLPKIDGTNLMVFWAKFADYQTAVRLPHRRRRTFDETNPMILWADFADYLASDNREKKPARIDETNPMVFWEKYTDCQVPFLGITDGGGHATKRTQWYSGQNIPVARSGDQVAADLGQAAKRSHFGDFDRTRLSGRLAPMQDGVERWPWRGR